MTQQEKQPQYFYVGQTVYHATMGKGEVMDIKHSFNCGVVARFAKGDCYFTFDGRIWPGEKITLSQNPIPEIVNHPIPEMPDLKEGDLVWCWDAQKERAQLYIFHQCIHGVEYSFCVWQNMGKRETVLFRHCEKYDPKKQFKPN